MQPQATQARRPFRMLFLSADLFPPFRVDVAALFGRELIGRGHEIVWVLQSEAPCDRPYTTTWNGAEVRVGATDLGEGRFDRLRKHLRGLANDLRTLTGRREQRFDIVQVKDKFLSALLALRLARRSGARFVFWLSYPFPESSLYEARTGVARYRAFYYLRGLVTHFLLYRIIAPRADHLMVQSEQMKRDVVAKGVDPRKVTAVPMGIVPEDFEQVVPAADMPPGRVVAYVGTLLQTRRLDFLVRVIARVLERVPDAVLLMVGPEELPGDFRILREEARRLGIDDRVVLTGRLERARALGYAAAADVCVSPFYPTPILNSTSPTKLVEYMALGRPVVANDHPEQQLVINESDCGICVPYDEAAFAEAIVTLLENPQQAAEQGRSGYRYVMAHRAYPAIADVVQRTYWHIIDGTPFPGSTAPGNR